MGQSVSLVTDELLDKGAEEERGSWDAERRGEAVEAGGKSPRDLQ